MKIRLLTAMVFGLALSAAQAQDASRSVLYHQRGNAVAIADSLVEIRDGIPVGTIAVLSNAAIGRVLRHFISYGVL